MVLDPLSAFSLACNVLQVIEVACRTLSTAAEYRQSTDGSLKEQNELRENSRSLKSLSTGLQSLLTKTTVSGQPSPEEARLNDANDECLRLSKEFLDFLDHLKVKDRNSTLESLRMSLKARWYKDRMDSMQQAISQARENLNMAFLLYMHSQQVLTSAQTQGTVEDSTLNLERSIIAAIGSSSLSIQEEIQRLAEQLKNTYLDADDQTASGFVITHQGILNDISCQLRAMSKSQMNVQIAAAENRDTAAQQAILDSLYFIQMEDRQEQVMKAYSSTYEWMLKPQDEDWTRWDCFSTWINEPKSDQRLYWVHGKPGSGKSTIMKYLSQNLDLDLHMPVWAGTRPVLTARCFFWAAGNSLQKSLRGLYRTLLYHLMEHCPEAIVNVVSQRRWRAATVRGGVSIEWTEPELRNTLTSIVEQLQTKMNILLLIDGLDEFDSSDEEREHLIDYILDLTRFEHLKVCVSSRPLNIFKEAFEGCPQLRLEDLTRNDIQIFTERQLQNNKRWHYYMHSDPIETSLLVEGIIDKASGVFLWVRLVVNDILQGLRDGDSMIRLSQTLETIPADLDQYFQSIIGSIEAKHQREASVLLQLALHQEDQFESLSPLSLMDISFMEEEDEAFVIKPGYDLHCLNLTDQNALSFRIDSTIRKLNSRCKGLLEVLERFDDTYAGTIGEGGLQYLYDPLNTNTALGSCILNPQLNEQLVKEGLTVSRTLRDVFTLRIKFLHRSLRDFLLRDKMQAFLHKHTQGPINARLFLCSARIVQLHALTRNGIGNERALRLSSYVMTALSVHRETRLTVMMAVLMVNPIDVLGNTYEDSNGGWYIQCAFRCWRREKSSFLTLAIDFNLTSYVLQYLSLQELTTKSGRPILDYILRPRFVQVSYLRVNNRLPEMQLLEIALSRGADPNVVYEDEGTSVWALFLCSLREMFAVVQLPRHDLYLTAYQTAAYQALQLMVEAGADLYLTQSALSANIAYESYFHNWQYLTNMNFRSRFKRRWLDLQPHYVDNMDENNNLYRVSDALEVLQLGFDISIKSLIEDVKSRYDHRVTSST